MTEGKNLKRQVRERMQRTGESYTTARRHVVARVGGADRHHDSALLARVLDRAGVVAPHTGLPYGEAMLAGLGGGIGFMYAVFDYGDIVTMTIVCQHHPEPFIPAALTRAGVPHEVKQTGSAAVAERNLRAVLAAGRTAVCRVDRYRLPWQEGVAFGDPYDVAVVGADETTAQLDGEGSLPFETLMAAWGGHKKGRHHLLSVTGTPPEVDLAAAIRDAIATTVAHLTGPVLGHSFDVNFGLSGMRKLAAQLADPKKGWQARFSTTEQMESALARLRACLEGEYGAPGAMRPLYADFLDEAAPLVSPRLAQAAGVYREAGAVWSALAVEAGRHASLDVLAAHASAAVALEERAVEALRL